jgi:predicted DNA-binding transcriptional regulator YafY
VARNAELIRQWEILREIDGARNGVPIAKLAATRGVHSRTIRRDIQALCDAGFPLYDAKVNGTSMWKLTDRPFKGLEQTGLSVTELCALHFSRAMLTTLAGVPLADDLERALGKLERALPVASRKYLDKMPLVVKVKATGRKKQDERRTREIAARAIDASLSCRRVEMRYDSASSGRAKNYVVEPLRLSYADGGVYLLAYVPDYQQVRTFALERIQTLAMTDEHFEPRALPPEPFANSLGVHSGAPERIEVEFDPQVAAFVTSREWHRSQEIVEREDGSVLVRLCVCNDAPLRRWIHSFGPLARVVFPSTLAREIYEEIEEARERYAPRLEALKMDLAAPRSARSAHEPRLFERPAKNKKRRVVA